MLLPLLSGLLSLACSVSAAINYGDLQLLFHAYPGYADLPLCGQCALAGSPPSSPCWGAGSMVGWSSCTSDGTVACICDLQRREPLSDYLTKTANRLCPDSDTATAPAAVALFEAFCAAAPSESSTSQAILATRSTTRDTTTAAAAASASPNSNAQSGGCSVGTGNSGNVFCGPSSGNDGDNSGNSGDNSGNSGGSKKLGTGAIAGITIGALASVLVVVIGLFWYAPGSFAKSGRYFCGRIHHTKDPEASGGGFDPDSSRSSPASAIYATAPITRDITQSHELPSRSVVHEMGAGSYRS